MLPFLLYLLSVKFSSVKSNFGLDFLFAGFLVIFPYPGIYLLVTDAVFLNGNCVVVAVFNAVADDFYPFFVCGVSSLRHIDITPSTSAGS